jgi:hypothetical protein
MNREEFRKRARIGLLYAFMYVGGPLLWGGWMVFRLRLFTPGEYLDCLTSPITVCMMAVFLAGNLANIHRMAGLRAHESGASTRSILRVHCASLVAFGTAGTFMFLVGPHGLKNAEWLARAGIGALSGASLVFLTYGFFTVAIFRLITENADTLRRLRGFYSTLFPLGVILFLTAAALAGLLQGLTVLGGASLAIPLATTCFLFIKTMYGANAVERKVTHGVA